MQRLLCSRVLVSGTLNLKTPFMKKYIIFALFLTFVAACDTNKGKHCPAIGESGNTGHLVDLSPVAWIPAIMDTLAKYPETLQANRVHFSWGYDPGSYSAIVVCNVYYKNLVVLNEAYVLRAGISAGSFGDTSFIPSGLSISIVPNISAKDAKAIAEKELHYKSCQASYLGILNVGGTKRDYRLVWRVRGAEGGYPVVDLDAHTGEVYAKDNGIRY